MSSRRTNNIKALLEQLESLKIMNEALNEYKWKDTEMLTVPAPAMTNKNVQAVMLKSMVLDLG